MCTECSVARAASSSPENGARAGVGGGWRIDGDGWSARNEGRGGGVWFADLVLAVMEEKQTDLTVTNEPSPLPAPTVSFLVNSFPYLQSRTAFSGTSAHLFASLPPTSHAFPNSLLLNFTLQLLGLLITSLTVCLKQHPSIQ